MMQRGFVDCGGRWTHWRALGTGPVVVMLHESPRSSTSLIPLMEALSSDFCCIALDTPGYGASDPLPERFAPIEAFADATLGALSQLSIGEFQLYGTHTGAAIACEVALRAPARVSSLLLDGFALFNDAEQAELLERYLLPQAPVWDGSHLMRIWSRIRDQALFFPFYDKSSAARLPKPNHDFMFMLRSCIGFLEAGDHYRDGYQAALTYDGNAKAVHLAIPSRLHVKEGDLIASHLRRAENGPLHVNRAPLQPREWLAETRNWLAQHTSPVLAAADLPQSPRRRFFNVDGQFVYAAAGEGHGVAIGTTDPHLRSQGMYGPYGSAHTARWFVDPPGFGTNAAANFGYAALEAALETPIDQITPASRPLLSARPGLDGQFLIASWYAMRDAFLEAGNIDRTTLDDGANDLSIAAITAGHLALVYSLCQHAL